LTKTVYRVKAKTKANKAKNSAQRKKKGVNESRKKQMRNDEKAPETPQKETDRDKEGRDYKEEATEKGFDCAKSELEQELILGRVYLELLIHEMGRMIDAFRGQKQAINEEAKIKKERFIIKDLWNKTKSDIEK